MSLERAAALGWPTITDPGTVIDPAASRLLPADAGAVGVSTTGRVLHVVAPQVPTAAHVAAWERASGHQVTVSVTTPDLFDRFAAAREAAQPRSLATLLDQVPDQHTCLELHTGHPPMMGTTGALSPVEGWPALSADEVADAAEFWVGGTRGTATVTWSSRRWRGVAATAAGRPSLMLRQVASTAVPLTDLDLPGDLGDVANLPSGLVLLASPAGHGRSTTFYAVADWLASHRADTTMLVVDEEEVHLPLRRSVPRLRVVGADVTSVADAVAGADASGVVLVDVTVLDAADVDSLLHRAAGGTLVVLTVAASSLTAAATRLLSLFAEDRRRAACDLLAHTFAVGVAQLLLPAPDGSARVPAAEVWWSTPAIAAALRGSSLAPLAAAATGSRGRHPNSSLRDVLGSLVAAGAVDREVAARYGWSAAEAPVSVEDVPESWVTTPATVPVSGARTRGSAKAPARRKDKKARAAETARARLEQNIDA